MLAIATFLVVAVLTLAFTRIATGALIATGVPPAVAAFQARSAFSGAGFTTTEAENVVNHPTRRRIIATTMFVGNLGTPTLIVSVMVGFIAPGPGSGTERSLVLFAGLVFVLLVVFNKPSQRWLSKLGQQYASRRLIPHLQEGYNELAAVGDDFVLGSIRIVGDPGETYRSLRGLDDALPDLQVVGVRQGDDFIWRRPADLEIHEHDELVVFGPRELVELHRSDPL